MNIVWNENPLKTVVELDETEKLLFREKYKTHYLLEERLYGAYHELTTDFRVEDKTPETRIAAAVAEMRIDYLMGDENSKSGQSFDGFITERANDFIKELSDEHCGDCIKIACSCSKCFAENLLGIDTIAGLHWGAYKIAGLFRAEGATLDSVIEALRTYEPGPKPATWPDTVGWEQHHPRWREDARRAHEGLVAYRLEHFSGSLRQSSEPEKGNGT